MHFYSGVVKMKSFILPYFSLWQKEKGVRGKILVVESPQEAEFEEFLIHPDVIGRKGRPINDETGFHLDLENGKLEHYRGTHVLYRRGILCGQSKNCRDLYESALAKYGSINFT